MIPITVSSLTMISGMTLKMSTKMISSKRIAVIRRKTKREMKNTMMTSSIIQEAKMLLKRSKRILLSFKKLQINKNNLRQLIRKQGRLRRAKRMKI